MKSKELSSKSADFAKAGSGNHMFGFRGTGTQTPDQSAQAGTGGRREGTAKGGGQTNASGSGNRDYAGSQEAGTSGASKSGGNSKFAEGGKTPMHGNTGSRAAKPGCSAQ